MRAAVIEGVGRVTVTDVPEPVPGPREVRGRGGRVRHLRHRPAHPRRRVRPGAADRARPRVRRRGRRARRRGRATLRAGDRVAVDPSLYCHECHYCRIGRNNLCERWNAIGVSVPGGAAEYAAAPAANCVVLPDQLPTRRRRADRAALVRGPRLRRPERPSRRPRPDLRLRNHGADDAPARPAHRCGLVDVVDLNPERLVTARRPGQLRDRHLRRRAGPPARLGAGHRRHRRRRRRSRTASAGSRRAAPSCSSASRPTRRGSPSTRTGSTTRRSPSPARWPSCTASSAPPSCSRAASSTRTCSSATGSRWPTTPAAIDRVRRGIGRKIQVLP